MVAGRPYARSQTDHSHPVQFLRNQGACTNGLLTFPCHSARWEFAMPARSAFWAFDKEAFKPGAVDPLQTQLPAVAVALTSRCSYLHRTPREGSARRGRNRQDASRNCNRRSGNACWRSHHSCNTFVQGLARDRAISESRTPPGSSIRADSLLARWHRLPRAASGSPF